MQKKRNLLSKLWLKYTNKALYKEYKWELRNYHEKSFNCNFIGNKRLNNLDKIKEVLTQTNTLNINHSGNAGDIIYALPTLKKIKALTGANINLYLRLDQPLQSFDSQSHPLGGVMLNQKMFDLLFPLLSKQSYISLVAPYRNENIHVDLDFFRAGVFPLDRGNIARWCGYITGVTPDLYQSWIEVSPNDSYKDTILLARSARYRNVTFNFSFLNAFKNVKFIGVASEYEEMKHQLPNLEWLQVTDFLELSEIIAGCKLFIGNQSFPFSIAEGLKVPRVLELPTGIINVVPEGPNGHDAIFHEHFEALVKELAK